MQQIQIQKPKQQETIGIELKDEERTRCEVWSRVVGYLRPVQQWNAGKEEEFKDRKTFDVGFKESSSEEENSEEQPARDNDENKGNTEDNSN